jgi:hypothetical protein
MSCLWHLDFDECGKNIAWYGRRLDAEIESDKHIIEQHEKAGHRPHPVEEDFDAVRRGYGTVIRTFFNDLINNPVNHLTPVCLHPSFCGKYVNTHMHFLSALPDEPFCY